MKRLALTITGAVSLAFAAAALSCVALELRPQSTPEHQSAPPVTDGASRPAVRVDAGKAGDEMAGFPRPLLTAPPKLSRRQQADSLALATDPESAFEAYALLAECQRARDEAQQASLTRRGDRDEHTASRMADGAIERHTRAACGDLSDADLAKRLVPLERAAEAGVPMAAIWLTVEGPWGDPHALEMRPQDPLVLAWRKRMEELLQLAARKGDLMALSSLSEQYQTGMGIVAGPDPDLALTYATAFHALYEVRKGRAALGKEAELKQLAAALSPEQAAQAREAGLRLVSPAVNTDR